MSNALTLASNAKAAQAALKAGDPTLALVAYNEASQGLATLQTRTIIDTLRFRAMMGETAEAVARIGRDSATGGDAVGQTEAAEALNAAGLAKYGDDWSPVTRKHIGECLRTANATFGNFTERTEAAEAAYGTPQGPKAWTATAVLVWIEATYKVAGNDKRKGTGPVTLADAAKAEAARTEAATQAEAATVARRSVLATRKGTAKVGGVVTLATLRNMSTEQLDELETVIGDLKAERAAEAKATAKAKAEADKAAKAADKATAAEAKAEAKAIVDKAKAEAEAMIAKAKAEAASVGK